jgi:uncharacterized protein
VIQGTLLVIPIEESLIYIRPLYLRASGGRIPELKRVIVAYENEIVMEATLDAAIERLFAKPGTPAQPATLTTSAAEVERPAEAKTAASTSGSLARLAGEARGHYERAVQAQREGNWALYGDEIKKLGEVLQRMGTQR